MLLENTFPLFSGGGEVLYGGSQSRSESKSMRECGCGVVGAMNLFLYLHRFHDKCKTAFFADAEDPVTPEQFEAYSKKLRRFIPLMYPLGINGITLMLGVNRFFSKYKLPFRARWCASKKKIWARTEEMLAADIPVILSIGPNFPLPLHRRKLTLYTRSRGGSLRAADSVCAHYVTVTGLEGDVLSVSSWGREYFILRSEFEQYVKKYSSSLYSNVLYIKPKSKNVASEATANG